MEQNAKLENCIRENGSDFDEIQIPVPWGHISGKWWGSKIQQPILAIHGRQDNAGTFDNLAPLLVMNGFSLLCIDLPGHGFSSHLPTGQYYYMFWDGIHILRRIIKYFKWSKLALLGHSMGGAIAFLYTATYPDDVEILISLDMAGPYIRPIDKVTDLLGETTDKLLGYELLNPEHTPSYDYNEIVKLTEKAYDGSINKKSCEILLKRGIKPTAEGKYTFTRDPRIKISSTLAFFTDKHVLEFASRIKCKVLFIRATAGLYCNNVEYYNSVLAAIKYAQIIEKYVVKGTHHVHLNDPEYVSELIVNFLENCNH